MKSGVITALYTLAVVKETTGLGSLPVKVVLNCDEETGSPDSRALIEREMAGAAGALVFEGRYDYDHAVITARKGILLGRLEVAGRAAHAGDAPEQGANAVVEAAHKTIALDRLNDLEEGTTVTVGRISGGKAVNQIPDYCRIEVDARFVDQEKGEKVEAEIRRILESGTVPGTRSRYELAQARPPMVRSAGTESLRDRYFQAAAGLGLPTAERSSGAGSDANLTAALGVPSLDGLGPEGDGPHTDQEYVLKESVLDSIRVSALLLSSLLLDG
jgi:glutamate carboxypeptidase